MGLYGQEKFTIKVLIHLLRSVIILDFGIRSQVDKNQDTTINNGVKVKTLSKDIKQYLITLEAQSRRKEDTYKNVVAVI